MKREYDLYNIKSNDFAYKLENILQNKSLTAFYTFNDATKILTLEGLNEMINNDFVIIKEVIHEIDPDIEIKSREEISIYRKVIRLENLDCANCASKVERIAQRTFSHESLTVDFVTSRFIIETKDKELFENIEDRLSEITKMVDRNIVVVSKKNENKVAPKDKKINKILFIIGSFLFVLSFILHYLVLPFISKNSDTFNYSSKEIISLEHWYMILICLVSYICLGYDVLLSAFNNIKNGRVFDEKFLMSLATLVAFGIGSFIEAASVMMFYKIGELLQDYVVNKSRKSIAALIDIKPDKARLLYNGKEMEVDPTEICPKDIILVKPGEKIPLDGKVIEGESSVDTSALTGESLYTDVNVGSKVISGSVNIDGVLVIEVEKSYKNSMVSKILDLVQNANVNKGKTEKFITKFAKYYTPIICGLAVLIVAINLIAFKINSNLVGSIHDCIYPGMIFLVVSCPCALVISVPMSYFGAIGGASKKGILVKGSNYLEQLNNVGRIIFDKTGTLTKGKFKIKSIESLDELYTAEDIFRIAAHCEISSNHPIAKTIVNEYGKEKINLEEIVVIQSNKRGATIQINDETYTIGNINKMKEANIKVKEIESENLVVYLSDVKHCIGYVILEDEIREEAYDTIQKLKESGYEVAMFTGDNELIAKNVAERLGIEEYYANLTPIDKVKKLRKLKKNLKDRTQVFVGDGINDAPVLANSDIGIAMGNLGSDAAIGVADVVLMKDELSKIPDILKIALKTRSVVQENITFVLVIKLIVLLMAVLNLEIPLMWEAIFADVGVSVIATINSLRAGNIEYVSIFDKIFKKNKVENE